MCSKHCVVNTDWPSMSDFHSGYFWFVAPATSGKCIPVIQIWSGMEAIKFKFRSSDNYQLGIENFKSQLLVCFCPTHLKGKPTLCQNTCIMSNYKSITFVKVLQNRTHDSPSIRKLKWNPRHPWRISKNLVNKISLLWHTQLLSHFVCHQYAS